MVVAAVAVVVAVAVAAVVVVVVVPTQGQCCAGEAAAPREGPHGRSHAAAD